MNSQFKKGILELCVLTLLKEQDYYGYQLDKAITEQINIAPGTIYPLLRRLKLQELTETYLVDSADGPSRKYYRLTPAGKKQQKALNEEWQKFITQVQKILRPL